MQTQILGGLRTVDIAYVRQTGGLNVRMAPSVAIANGAQWRRIGTEPWRDHNTTEQNLPTGDYTVEFKAVENYFAPPASDVTVTTGTSIYTFRYIDPTNLRVRIEPSEARAAGARWRRAGTEAWFEHNTVENFIPSGTHTIEFAPADGWLAPAPMTLDVPRNSYTLAVTYERKTAVAEAWLLMK